ncbi:MAG: 8-amino-7-oxononanoate synthase [Bacteroidota bacterium]|nr:8-amino-7-oxononanoate synthase [Bacteroidota bacterium]
MGEDFLDRRLDERRQQNAMRSLRLPEGKTDFCSNDYLGIATNGLIEAHLPPSASAPAPHPLRHGSGGSRLLAGNYPLIKETERHIASFHESEAALIFNSGYDANLGLMSAIPQRNDIVLYDHLSHASIRDGIRLSFARSFSFAHNDLADLQHRLESVTAQPPAFQPASVPPSGPTSNPPAPPHQVFVVTESLFSMDGDQAPLPEIVRLCDRFGAHLMVDEAHATGVIGRQGEGLVQSLGLEHKCFARVHTFGKALGCHGAAVLGSASLRDCLINFARSFIYTTALPESSVAAIRAAYDLFPGMTRERQRLQEWIERFHQAPIRYERLNSHTPIQVVIVPGNDEVKSVSDQLQAAGLDVRPILYPTVPRGAERLRIVLHSFNTPAEIDRLVGCLK